MRDDSARSENHADYLPGHVIGKIVFRGDPAHASPVGRQGADGRTDVEEVRERGKSFNGGASWPVGKGLNEGKSFRGSDDSR